ncbi:hypothetical protein BDV95DRAFT_611480 [Massariosphaeria phaeospora]|uniref:Uncharacterized protein n=1 Tax=Massariosphaeria phaeospora TaxID=100035 RepID=A0A7C8HZZ4_9PLEO|nr:hypothetical protein BDV95DRAFT_611480 [Massariosphaeria phaeospora]
MAPHPLNAEGQTDNANKDPTPPPPNSSGKWGTPAIVAVSIFAVFALVFTTTMVLWYLHRRAAKAKLPPSHRQSSYRPFRSSSSAKAGLLANAAPTPEDDKSNMFTRHRGSSVSLYVDTEMHDARNKRASMDTVSLIPLHVTPALDKTTLDRERSPIEDQNLNTVSGLSRASSRYSVGGSLALSPLSPMLDADGDLGNVKTRPRSTSAASQRYYDRKSSEGAVPSQVQIPTIVHTTSP